MSKTRAELINQSLTNLGIFIPEQSIDPQSIAKMDTIVDPALSELADMRIYYVQDAGNMGPVGGEIEDSAFLSLAAYIANAACAAFNLPADQKMQALSLVAEAKLVTLAAPSRTFKKLRIDPALSGRRGWYGGWF